MTKRNGQSKANQNWEHIVFLNTLNCPKPYVALIKVSRARRVCVRRSRSVVLPLAVETGRFPSVPVKNKVSPEWFLDAGICPALNVCWVFRSVLIWPINVDRHIYHVGRVSWPWFLQYLSSMYENADSYIYIWYILDPCMSSNAAQLSYSERFSLYIYIFYSALFII